MSDETPGAGQSAVPPREPAVRFAQMAGGQFVLTTSSSSQNPAITQINVGDTQRLIHLSPSRVPPTIQAQSSLRPSQTNQSIVKALQQPRSGNVRQQLFGDASTPQPQPQPPQQSTRAPVKRSLPPTPEKKDTYATKLQRVLNHRNVRSTILREKYNENLVETYHLELGGNLLDLYQFAKRPKTAQLLQYMKENSVDPKECEEVVAASTALPTATAASSLPGLSTSSTAVTAASTKATAMPTNTPKVAKNGNNGSTSVAATPTAATSTPTATAANTSEGNPEQIVEKAKHEAYVVQRINDLQKEGLWSEKRLPRVAEMPRQKAHWDYLLEEMVWLAADFAQERKWKKAAAKKCARMVQKYFQDKAQAAQRAEKAHEQHMRRVAAFVAKEVKLFWCNVEKLVEYKQNTRLEEKRKQALDQHLSFIVDQTEKYSQLLTEAMNKPLNVGETSRGHSDDEFQPGEEDEEDDEETIALEEAEDGGEKAEEVAALQRESQMDFDDFLSELPKDYLQNREKIKLSDSESEDNSQDAPSTSSKSKDVDFTADASSEDDEDTIQEQEKAEGALDHRAEIDDLENEAEMDIEELRSKYANLPSVDDQEESLSTPASSISDDDEDDECDGDDLGDSVGLFDDGHDTADTEDDKDLGLRSLLDDSKDNANEDKTDNNDLINDAAAIAESIQPKGNTLSSTSVVTNVPFLLKFPLREYQHIGLDWLVTMFERKLNGILADEMGLGKTIQTIALLAHLACEKSNWGPHLIVVPTSVMLNWEMECKKWCPGFKILTYYGSQKERKLKRTGWTKPNAFHICITSYKLVIQDHQSFRRKKWKYLILDEAQNIKNFKSQRWQLLLNFQTQQRLLLTGTPLQNNLMELWSLMHFLMPNVFQSHREFKEWFSNPVTGMIEGNSEYNENIIKRLHKVLRPFLLRRLKCEVEKQMPKKYEHVVMCRLSKRQRFLYDDYMSRAKTKDTLASGNLLSVINILMQLRKVCNHPNLFEARPTISPFHCEGIVQHVPSLVYSVLDYNVWEHVDLITLNLNLLHLEFNYSAYQCYRLRQYQTPKKLIEEIASTSTRVPPCPPSRLCLKVHKNTVNKVTRGELKEASAPLAQKVKLIQHQGGLKAVPITPSTANQTGTINLSSVLKPSLPGFAQLVQTSTGKHILLTPTCNINTGSIGITGTTTVMTSSGQKLTVLPKQSLTAVTASNNQAAIAKAVVKVQLTSLAPLSGQPTCSDADMSASRKTIDTKFIERLYMQSAKNKSLDVRWAHGRGKTGDENCEDALAWRRYKLNMLARFNSRRCNAAPIYGQDFIASIRRMSESSRTPWAGGSIACQDVQYGRRVANTPDALKDLIYTPVRLIDEFKEIFDRFIVYVPSVHAPEPELQVWNPNPSTYWGRMQEKRLLAQHLSAPTKALHPIASSMITQFPHPRLIQYDCGKLQTLDSLLRKLKYGGHRVLIFTQMTKMLDVLEAFLNFHGHIYLRLDGSTKIDQRQILMERFNGDARIFVFILSTRSGGVGVNLTGADTVIFYDSDWNPTMDAQAQDRCHRIGQTRDVHIYRLVSEMTIEENILKKANQKRLLGDLAIEGGNFTTAYFKSSTIQDLFTIDKSEESAATRMSEVVELSREREKPAEDTLAPERQCALESAFASAEDDQDVIDARTAQAEAVADLAEFDENIPLEEAAEKEKEREKEPEISKAEQEVQNLMRQLTPIEKYAMRFIEETESAWSEEQLAAAEREIEDKKRAWEENRLATMREEEERRARELEEESELLTFSREDATNQIWVSNNTNEHMPMWCPPTPPQQDGDVYVDPTLTFLYNSALMTETQLPAVYVKKEPKRTRTEAGLPDSRRPVKMHKREDVTQPPKSIFDRLPLLVKMRRDAIKQKYRSGLIRPSIPLAGVKYPSVKPLIEQPGHGWTIHEDAAILKVIQSYQGLNLNLMITCAGHTPNWDFVADYVNTVSATFRSSKQCRNRYESVLIPREEGKQTMDASPKKKKQKTGGMFVKFPAANKSNRPMRTSQLYVQDNNATFTSLMMQRFDAIRTIVAKRPPTSKPTPSTSAVAVRNPKHETILIEAGIDLEHPMTAVEIAAKRVERIEREKKPDLQYQQKLQLLRQVQQAQAAAAQSAAAAAASASSSAAVTQIPVQVTATSVNANATSTVTVPMVSMSTPPPNPSTPPSTSTLRMQRIVASPLTNQSVVSVSGISPAQLQAATQRLIVSGAPGSSKTTVVGAGAIAGKTISHAQLQMLRNASLKQQQQMRLQSSLNAQALKTTTVVTIPGQTATAVQVQLTQAQPRIIKGATVVTGKQVTRPMTEAEVAQFLKMKQNQQKLAAASAQGQTTIANQQVFAQTLQAGPSGTQVATIVKAVSSSGVTQTVIGTPVKNLPQGIKAQQATQQQMRALHLQQLVAKKQLGLNQQKITGIAQVAGKGGMATQLIVGSKPLSTAMTMQQFQQVIRSPLSVPQGGPVVLAAKGASRMIPVSAGQGNKPTIQVVSAPSIRPATATTLTASLAGRQTVQQQQAILSQVVLGQNVRQNSPVRIHTSGGTASVVAVSSVASPHVISVQQQQQQQQVCQPDKPDAS